MKSIKISIIIPVYNASKTIKRCIDSIIKSENNEFEVIAVNDGSTDDSVEILKDIAIKDSRVKIVSKKNGGVSSARNKGIESAKGQYIMFVDADDWLELNAIDKLIELLSLNDVDILKFNYQRVSNKKVYKNNIQEFVKTNIILNDKDYYECISLVSSKTNFFNPVWGQVFKKNIINNLFDETVTYGEDFLFNINLFEKAKNIYISDEIFYNYYENNTGISMNISVDMSKRKIENLFIIYDKIINYINEISFDEINKELIKLKFINELTNNIIKLFAFGTSKNINYIEEKLFQIDENFISKQTINNNQDKFASISKLLLKKQYRKVYIFSKYIFKPVFITRRGIKNVTSKE